MSVAYFKLVSSIELVNYVALFVDYFKMVSCLGYT
jgi:hypothetical protein